MSEPSAIKNLNVNGTTYDIQDDSKLASSLKGAAGGVAELDSGGKVPSSQLPSYVDDVLEYDTMGDFPLTGESGKIYVAIDTNKTYRWSGSAYVEISASLALGETENTAYRGDRGKTAYDHATDTNRLTTAQTEGLYKVATTEEGHIKSVSAVQKSDITGLGIPAQDTTYSVMTGAGASTAGSSGLVPAPSAGDENKVLKGDGTWGNVGVLPSVTTSDNGKVLEVSEGVWAVGTEKAPIANPSFTGSISMNRSSGTTVGENSIAVGGSNVEATGARSAAFNNGKARANNAFACGSGTASGVASMAEGSSTTASGTQSHAEGYNTTSSGQASHAENLSTTASGHYSHSQGVYTIAKHYGQSAAGWYNVADPSTGDAATQGTYAEIIGNGTADDARSNARTLDWAGNERLKGNIYVGCNADSTGGSKLGPILSVSVSATSSTSTTVSNSKITADHIVLNDSVLWGNDLSYTTSAGEIALSCSSGIPAMTLYLGVI